ncbi:MAG: hypothetical protein ACYCV7_10520 [Acidimicrobiales bacterium]
MPARRATRRQAGVATAAGAAALAYGWAESAARTFTWPARVATGVIVVGVFLYPWWLRRSRAGTERPPRLTMATVVVWSVVAAVVVAWELIALLHGPRNVYPTISSLYVAAAKLRLVRAMAFSGWMALGVWIARR